MMTLTLIPCDLCGGITFTLLYPATLDADTKDLSRYFTSSRTIAGHLDIVRCDSCGLVMSNPRDDDSLLADVYQRLQDETYEAEEINRAYTAETYIRWINKHLSPGRVMDVGCSTGLFLEKAASTGWQVSGVEPSAWSATKASERNPQAKIYIGRLDKISFPSQSFDLVTFWDVLEHVPSPTAALESVVPWLSSGGYLAMNLPNHSSYTARWMGKTWVHYLREHLWYFSPRTITRLLNKTGFEVVQIRPNMVRFSLANIFTRLSQYRGIPSTIGKTGRKITKLHRLSFRFPTGEMNVLARKS
jgi:2-polyprenyl-3-methyl-5-hydroxy-6-metoxy-1,4-benzoquinol methylase